MVTAPIYPFSSFHFEYLERILDAAERNCSYDLGMNSFVTKPVTFESLVELMKSIGKYWFEIVELPPETKIID